MDIEELLNWSLAEIRGGISSLLPEGWQLEEKVSDGFFFARISRPGEEEVEIEWVHFDADERLVLLGAYMHLRLKGHEPHSDSFWIRRNNPTREAVTKRVVAEQKSKPESGPEDLDPSEVASVYENASKTKWR